MRSNDSIFTAILETDKLEAAVQALTDAELRNLRGALARGEFSGWPAEVVHGVCIAEGCERFMNQVPSVQHEVISEAERDAHHGSEVKS